MSGAEERVNTYRSRRSPSLPELRPTLPDSGAAGAQEVGSNGHLGHEYLTNYRPLFAHSRSMRAIREIIEDIASSDATVLIRGESGVGKDVAARAIHAASPRHAGPFVKVNSAALPAELLESELFGHEKGAFTGAYRRKLGTFEYANNGTLFLDEIGDLPVTLQAKLLQVLQDFEFYRIGGRELIRVNTQVIVATNRNLEEAVACGRFREDLYYRLNVVEIRIPPLRERKEEIRSLAAAFLARFNTEYDRNEELSAETLDLLVEYHWPGNVRELANLIQRLVVLRNSHQVHEELRLRVGAASARRTELPNAAAQLPMLSGSDDAPAGLKEIARRAARDAERKALADVLGRVHWNRTEAARILRVSYKTLLHKITECGLGPARGQGK